MWIFHVGLDPQALDEEDRVGAADTQCYLWSLPGKSSCRASLGGASQSDTHKAMILQFTSNEDCAWTLERPENMSARIVFSHIQ